MLVLLLVACEPEVNHQGPDGVCHVDPVWGVDSMDIDCPCADRAFDMTRVSRANCRADQVAEVQWSEQPDPHTTVRNDDEDQVLKALVLCRCVRDN